MNQFSMIESRLITFNQDEIIEALEIYYNLKQGTKCKFYKEELTFHPDKKLIDVEIDPDGEEIDDDGEINTNDSYQ